MQKFLILLLTFSQIFTIKQVNSENFNYILNNHHVFIIACLEQGDDCDRFQNNFLDEWEIFNFKFSKSFPSKIYSLIKGKENEDFFNKITSNSMSSLIVYIEHQNIDFKRYIDPQTSSQRVLRKWMRDIEGDFAEKIIDQKIEELDKVINDQKTIKKTQQNQNNIQEEKIQLDDYVDQEEDNEVLENDEEIVDELVAIDDQGNEEIETKITKLKDGDVVSEKSYHENQDLINLENQINDEEVKSKQFRELDVHDLNVEQLDEQEQDSLTKYLNKIKDDNQSGILGKFQKRIIPQSDDIQPTRDIQNLNRMRKNFKNSREVKPKKSKYSVSLKDIDLGKLNKEQAEEIKKYFNEKKQNQKINQQIYKEEFIDNPNRAVFDKEMKKQAMIDKKKQQLTKYLKKPVIQQPTIMIQDHVIGIWVYLCFLFLLFLVFIRIYSFFKTSGKKINKNFYAKYDIEENTAIVAEI